MARAVFDGVEAEEEDIFPDSTSEMLADFWRNGTAKALEREDAAFVQPTAHKTVTPGERNQQLAPTRLGHRHVFDAQPAWQHLLQWPGWSQVASVPRMKLVLPTRLLGNTGLRLTTLGIGCAWLGRRADGSIDRDAGLATVLAALDAGIRLIDTASLYAQEMAESMVGEALRQRPDLTGSVIVETKVRDRREFEYTADETRRSVETSLQRLGVDHIPMVYIHDPPAQLLDRVLTPGGALGGLRRLQAEGIVGHVGIASNNPWDNAPYVETGEFEAAVVPDAFSLISQVAWERIFPAAERFDMGVVIATPLERGLLATGTRALRPEDHINRTFRADVLQHVARLEEVCAAHGVSLLAAALQYVVRPGVVSATIPGFRSPDQPTAAAGAMLEPIPGAFWQEVEPLVRDFRVALPPA